MACHGPTSWPVIGKMNIYSELSLFLGKQIQWKKTFWENKQIQWENYMHTGCSSGTDQKQSFDRNSHKGVDVGAVEVRHFIIPVLHKRWLIRTIQKQLKFYRTAWFRSPMEGYWGSKPEQGCLRQHQVHPDQSVRSWRTDKGFARPAFRPTLFARCRAQRYIGQPIWKGSIWFKLKWKVWAISNWKVWAISSSGWFKTQRISRLRLIQDSAQRISPLCNCLWLI